jgi:hypothetical protein
LLTIHVPAWPISLCYVMWMFASGFCILRGARVNRKGTHKTQRGLLVSKPCQRSALLDSEVPRFDAVTNDIGDGCMNSAGCLAERTQAFDAAQSSRFWECRKSWPRGWNRVLQRAIGMLKRRGDIHSGMCSRHLATWLNSLMSTTKLWRSQASSYSSIADFTCKLTRLRRWLLHCTSRTSAAWYHADRRDA